MITVRLVSRVGAHRKGAVLSLDDASAASLVGRGDAEAVRLDLFEPADHTVAQVREYLAGVDEAEAHRVLDAERRGRGRAGVLDA